MFVSYLCCVFLTDSKGPETVSHRCVLLFSLQVSEVEEQVSKHQIVLRSSSKPTKVENADELTDLNDTFANDDAESQSDTDTQTQEEAAGRDTVTKKKNEIAKGASPKENEISDKRLQDEESDKTENADMETEEEEHLETLRWGKIE